MTHDRATRNRIAAGVLATVLSAFLTAVPAQAHWWNRKPAAAPTGSADGGGE